jgi:hypothetical protein
MTMGRASCALVENPPRPTCRQQTPAIVRSGRCCSRHGTRKSAGPAPAHGAYTRSADEAARQDRGGLNMDMLGRNEEVPAEDGGRFRGLQPQTAESNNNAIQRHRHQPQRRHEDGRRQGERGRSASTCAIATTTTSRS